MEISNRDKSYKDDHNVTWSCEYHCVFCSKYTRNSLDEEVQKRLSQVILNGQSKLEYELLGIEMTLNHVHLILKVNPLIGIYETVTRIKNLTSNILRSEFPKLKSALPSLWTHHRLISSCGSVSISDINNYIESQRGK